MEDCCKKPRVTGKQETHAYFTPRSVKYVSCSIICTCYNGKWRLKHLKFCEWQGVGTEPDCCVKIPWYACYLRSQGPIHNMTQTRCCGRESRNLALKEEISINVILMQTLKTAMWKGPGQRGQNKNPQAGRNCFIFIFLEVFFMLVLWCLDLKWSETSVDMPHLIISLAETCWL